MHIELPYGHGTIRLEIPRVACCDVLSPASLPPLSDLAADLSAGLDRPLGAKPLEAGHRPESVAIAVPDETRPTPVKDIAPVILDRLFARWPDLERSRVTVIVGGGLHEPAPAEAMARILPPEAARGCRVLAHDAHNSPLADLGRTSRGTPVLVNAVYAAADLKIVIGQIDPHQFMGYTGGAKGVTVGCAGAEAIRASHSLLLQDSARGGVLAGNPARDDVSEAGRMVGIDLAVNVVLNAAKKPVWIGVGAPDAVLAEGAEVCARVYGVDLAEPYDLVVASCGGYPKDLCLYQAQKGLNTAGQAVRPGGRVLLCAECGQGVGDDAYYDYVCRFETMGGLMDDFRAAGFRMGAHKAFLFGRTLAHCEVVVHSALDPETLRRCHLTPGDAQATLDHWIFKASGPLRIAVIPNANTTFFRLAGGRPACSGSCRG